MGGEAVGMIATVVSTITGLAVYLLSRRSQRMAVTRQAAIDQGPYVESLQGWSRDIVAWYKTQTDNAKQDCEQEKQALREELRQARMEWAERIRHAESFADHWRKIAQGEISDDTPPPEPRPIRQ